MALDKAKEHKARDHDADFAREQQAACDLEDGLGCGGSGPERALFTGGDGDHEGREKPVADHDDHHDVIFAREVARETVLHCKDKGGERHEDHAKARVILHALSLRWSCGVCVRNLARGKR